MQLIEYNKNVQRQSLIHQGSHDPHGDYHTVPGIFLYGL